MTDMALKLQGPPADFDSQGLRPCPLLGVPAGAAWWLMDSDASAGGRGQLVDGLALRARRWTPTPAHNLPTAALENRSDALAVPHSCFDNGSDALAVANTAHSHEYIIISIMFAYDTRLDQGSCQEPASMASTTGMRRFAPTATPRSQSFGQGDRHPSEWVIGLARNGRSTSSEYALSASSSS